MDDDEGESQLTNLLELIDDDCVARVLRPAPLRRVLRPLSSAGSCVHSLQPQPPRPTSRLRRGFAV